MTDNLTTPGTTCAEEYTVKRGDSFYLIAHKLGVPLRDLLAANRDIHPARLMVGDVLCIPREEDDSPSAANNGGLNGTGGSNSGAAGSNSGTMSSTAPDTSGQAGIAADRTGGTQNGSGTAGSRSGSGTASGTAPDTSSQAGTAADIRGGTSNTSGTTDCNTGTNGSESAPSCPIEQQFIVQRGQSVSDIQLRSLLSRHTLETANPDVDLDSLRVGQTICVPTENVPCPLPATYTLQTSETLEAVALMFNLPVSSLLRANPCLAPQDFEAGVTVALPG